MARKAKLDIQFTSTPGLALCPSGNLLCLLFLFLERWHKYQNLFFVDLRSYFNKVEGFGSLVIHYRTLFIKKCICSKIVTPFTSYLFCFFDKDHTPEL